MSEAGGVAVEPGAGAEMPIVQRFSDLLLWLLPPAAERPARAISPPRVGGRRSPA